MTEINQKSVTLSPCHLVTSVGLWAQLACIWEATARKAGNVHRYRDFTDTHYCDFLMSAAAIGPVLDQASTRRVGDTVLHGVRATRQVTNTNTNLGILLLLAPLAATPMDEPLRPGLERVLANLDVADSIATYEAIRLAQPGGLGQVEEQDVAAEPTLPLREIMALAADRDLIALQYCNGFAQIFDEGVPALGEALSSKHSLESAIQHAHLRLLAKNHDSLIVRKRGLAEAQHASALAERVLCAPELFDEFDAWLRAEGHERNPGTTADLVAASLFVALREHIITLPCQFERFV